MSNKKQIYSVTIFEDGGVNDSMVIPKEVAIEIQTILDRHQQSELAKGNKVNRISDADGIQL